ncbi:MAG: peptidoglycan DD-metalloendopeptidase family protein [Patescibacteria group bacterium]
MKLHHREKTQYTSRFTRWMSVCVLFIATISPILFFSTTAHAGLFSFFSELLGSQEVSARVEPVKPNSNSQTLALLQAPVNINPNPHQSGELTPVINGALVADLAAADSTGGAEEMNTQISLYTVREGDNLSTIAQMFNVTVNTIMWANDINKASAIQPGQTLIILPVSGINYKVKKGDTILSIAKEYKVADHLDEILNYNGLSLNSALAIGDTIIIPDAELETITPTKTSSGSAVPSGYYMRPIKIGYRSQGIHGHNGVDLAAPVGTPIYASAGGRVIASVSNGGWNGGYGNYVIISHPNGTQTLYAHTSKNYVALGQVVEKGTQIAAIGLTGKTTGPHVHFEIRGAKNPF